MPWITAGLEAGGTAHSSALQEMYRMADAADKWNAAAPDLLAALEAVIDDLVCTIQEVKDNGGSQAWIDGANARLANARAAIAKAKGN